MDNEKIQIEIEEIESVKVTSLDGELEAPRRGIARFTVELNPAIVITRKALIYPDGRVYLDDQS
jgi:hypothetical protein